MRIKRFKLNIKLLLVFLCIATVSLSANALQDAIDNASAGSTLKLSKGIYRGKLVITKAITLVGKESGVIIQGDNTGDVVTIKSSNVSLKNLTITNSGSRLDNLDSAILIDNANNCQIIKCTILDSLYGINTKLSNNTLIENNYITSKDEDISLKGDALKIWYGNNNIVKNNIIDNSRDNTFTYSHNNQIMNNTFINNRFGLHISHAKNNTVKNNTFKYNSVSIITMGIKDMKILNNRILSSIGAAGIGVVVKGSSNFLFQDNIVSFNAQALYIDSKTTELGMQRYIINNEISYNKEALHFHEAIKNNTITRNKVFGNIDDVVKDVRGIYPSINHIEYNYWDRYAGFDSNEDNVGDTPYQVYQYADQLWHYNRKVKFFYGSPIMSLLNFLANLAPFVEPLLLLEDTKPIVNVKEFIK